MTKRVVLAAAAGWLIAALLPPQRVLGFLRGGA